MWKFSTFVIFIVFGIYLRKKFQRLPPEPPKNILFTFSILCPNFCGKTYKNFPKIENFNNLENFEKIENFGLNITIFHWFLRNLFETFSGTGGSARRPPMRLSLQASYDGPCSPEKFSRGTTKPDNDLKTWDNCMR